MKDGKFVNLGEYPPESDPKFSRLKVFALTMPVTFTQKFGKGFSFSAGAVVNFNTHASMKTKYINNNDEVTLANSNIHQRKVTVDVMGQFNFKALCRCSTQNLAPTSNASQLDLRCSIKTH